MTRERRSFTVRDLPVPERPRERLMREGPRALTREEILAVILGRGTSGRSVLDIARDLIVKFKTIGALADATIHELQQIEGIGKAKACQLKAALELARRTTEYEDAGRGADLSNAEVVARLVGPRVRGEKKECFYSLVADSRGRLLTWDTVSVGSLDTTLAHPREVFQEAVRAKASAIVVVHNHPSGDPSPSDDDIRLTRRLAEAGRILGIALLDHIILAHDRYYSFREHALL